MTDTLSALIEQHLRALGIEPKGGPPHRFLPVPGLYNRRVLLVDDSREVMRSFIPALIMVTNGAAQFILHQEQPRDELLAAMIALQPEVVLLDGELSGVERGWNVCADLVRRRSDIPVLGFSSDPGYESRFISSNALGFVQKRIKDVHGSLLGVEAQLKTLLG